MDVIVHVHNVSMKEKLPLRVVGKCEHFTFCNPCDVKALRLLLENKKHSFLNSTCLSPSSWRS